MEAAKKKLPRPSAPCTKNSSYSQRGSRRDRAHKWLLLSINDRNRIGYKIVTVFNVSLWCPGVPGFVRSYVCSRFFKLSFFFSALLYVLRVRSLHSLYYITSHLSGRGGRYCSPCPHSSNRSVVLSVK